MIAEYQIKGNDMTVDIKLPPLPEPTVVDGEPYWFDSHMKAYALAAIKANREQRGEPVAWPTHEFAIVVDRIYEGEGPSLAMWNGENYNFTDGDCYDREPDGSLDGYTAEWLTHHQLERRLFAAPKPAAPSQEPSVPEQTSKIVNDACWKFVEAMPHPIPGPIFNELKPALYAAICHVLARYGAAPSPKDDK